MSGLPDGWVEAAVDDTGAYINGMAFKPTDWEQDGRPIIRIQNLTDPNKPLNRTTREVEDRYIVFPGDLLVSWSATLDAFIWDREEAVLNQHIFKVEPNTDLVDPRFLFFGLREVIAEMREGEHLHGSTMKHINRGPFLAHRFPIPPLTEQRRIVAKLDRLSARTKAARAHLARVQSLATRAKQAFTRQLIREKTWETARFLDVCEAYQPRTISKAQMKPDGQFPVFGANGKIGFFDEFNHENPELLVTCRGATCGAVNVSEPFSWINGNAMVIKGKSDGYVLDFLKAYFSHGFDFSDVISGSAQPQITRQSLAKLQMPIVPIDEQQTLVRRIEAAFARIDRMVEDATRAAHLLDRLDQRLLAKAFCGELVPQDPNDEPAAELLARIEAARAAAPKSKRSRRQRA